VWLGIAVGVIVILLPSRSVTYEVPEKPSAHTFTKDEIANYIIQESKKVGVNPGLALCIVEHESSFDPNKKGDLDFIGASLGLWQLNSYYHPEAVEFAFDVESSTQWSLDKIKKGYGWWWSTYKLCNK